MSNGKKHRNTSCGQAVVRMAALSVLAATASAAQAVVVLNITDGTTLFADDFESGLVNTDLGAAVLGSWGPSGDAPGRQIYKDSATQSGVTPFQGNQFAKLVKDYNGAPNPLYLETTFDAGAVANSGAGDLIRLETAFRVNPRGGLGVNTFGFIFVDSAGPAGPRNKNDFMEFQLDDTGKVYGTDLNTFSTVMTPTHTVGAWNTLRIDYVNGSGSFDLSVNGGTPQTITNGPNFDGNITGMSIINYDTAASAGVYLDAVTTINNPRTWAVNASGDWNDSANWTGGLPPNGVDATAQFFSAISSPRTVYTDVAVTAGTLQFDNANGYQITGQGSLTLQESSNSAQVSVLQGTHKINLPLTIASNTSLNVASGATLKISDPVTVNAGKSLASTGAGTVSYESTVTLLSGASIAFASSQHVAALTVGNNASATLAASNGARVLRTDAMSISATGGQIDLKDNKLITSQAAGSWNGSNYTGVAGLVKSGRNGGAWNGAGIVTSMTSAAPASQLTTLAVAAAGDVGKTSFAGQSVAASDTLVMYTYTGDANLSGKVDADDYFAIDSHYNKTASSAKLWINGDFNYDGKINGDDYMLIDAAYVGQGTPFLSASGGDFAGASAVPEPGCFSLFVLGAAGALRRRSRQVQSQRVQSLHRGGMLHDFKDNS